jgi:hypothetical protein
MRCACLRHYLQIRHEAQHRVSYRRGVGGCVLNVRDGVASLRWRTPGLRGL